MADTEFQDTFSTVWRENETDGIGSEPHEPVKGEIRQIGAQLDAKFAGIQAAAEGGLISYATWAQLAAHPTGDLATGDTGNVTNDAGTHTDPIDGGPPVANEGVYSYKTGSPNGWRRIADLPAVAAEAWVALAQEWAEGTAPGGTGTQSAREWAEDSEEFAEAAAESATKFDLVFELTDTVTGKLIRLKVTDGGGLERILADVDEDIGAVGITFRSPVNVLPGNWTLASLAAEVKAQMIQAATDTTSGYLFRIVVTDALGVERVAFGLPEDMSSPITAYVSRAVTADDSAGGVVTSANADYVIQTFKDGGGIKQLRSVSRNGAHVVVLTAGATDATAPMITPDNRVIFTRDGLQQWVSATGGRVRPIRATTALTPIGDSMSDPGSGYVDALPARLPGRTIYDVAEGGERTEGIAVSYGVAGLLTLAVTGNALPTSGTVACVPNIPFLPGTGTGSVRVNVTAASGAVVPCYVIATSGAYTIRPAAYPGAPISLSNPAPAVVASLQSATSDPSAAVDIAEAQEGVALIRCGRNNVSFSYDLADVLAKIAGIVATVGPLAKAYLVMGVTNGYSDLPVSMGGNQPSEAASKVILDRIDAINAALAAAYPANYRSPLANHIALGGSTNHTIAGEIRAVLNSVVLSDGIHENAQGKTNTADLVGDFVEAEGY